jgi:hypothetical protein
MYMDMELHVPRGNERRVRGEEESGGRCAGKRREGGGMEDGWRRVVPKLCNLACAIARLLDTHIRVSVGGRLAWAPAMNEMIGIRHSTTKLLYPAYVEELHNVGNSSMLSSL